MRPANEPAAYSSGVARIGEVQAKKMNTIFPLQCVKLLTDLQILGCELHTKCVWRPGSARTHWGHYSAPPDSVAVIRGVEGGKGKETVVNRNERKGMEGKTMKR